MELGSTALLAMRPTSVGAAVACLVFACRTVASLVVAVGRKGEGEGGREEGGMADRRLTISSHYLPEFNRHPREEMRTVETAPPPPG